MRKNKRRSCLAVLSAFAVLLPTLVSAQIPPRFYWKNLSGSNAVPVIYQSLSGNANPLDPAHVVSASANFEADVAVAGYGKVLPLFDRPAMLAVLAPMGNVSVTGTVAGNTVSQSASGYGDPMVEFNIGLIGTEPIMTIPDFLRYEPEFSLDLIVDLAIPIGEYDNDQAVNLGQNRWYGRIGAPIVWQIGAWVPGRRTTVELLPSIWFFGDNDDYLVGQNLETDPMFQVEAHLTRDFTEHFWGSVDASFLSGGKSTVDGQSGSSLNNISLGYTLGYQINENLQFTFAYTASVDDSDPGDLQMDGFRISFVFGWHPLIEGMGRLGGGE